MSCKRWRIKNTVCYLYSSLTDTHSSPVLISSIMNLGICEIVNGDLVFISPLVKICVCVIIHWYGTLQLRKGIYLVKLIYFADMMSEVLLNWGRTYTFIWNRKLINMNGQCEKIVNFNLSSKVSRWRMRLHKRRPKAKLETNKFNCLHFIWRSIYKFFFWQG